MDTLRERQAQVAMLMAQIETLAAACALTRSGDGGVDQRMLDLQQRLRAQAALSVDEPSSRHGASPDWAADLRSAAVYVGDFAHQQLQLKAQAVAHAAAIAQRDADLHTLRGEVAALRAARDACARALPAGSDGRAAPECILANIQALVAALEADQAAAQSNAELTALRAAQSAYARELPPGADDAPDPQAILDNIVAMKTALEAVRHLSLAAVAWWEGYRPLGWSAADHVLAPLVNIEADHGAHELARAAAAAAAGNAR